MSHRCEDGHAEVRGHEGGDDDDEREERDERLARQGDAAVDDSVSSIRSQTFHSSVCSAQPRMTWTRPRTFSNVCRLVLSVLDSAMIPSLVSTDRTRLQGTPTARGQALPARATRGDNRLGRRLTPPRRTRRAARVRPRVQLAARPLRVSSQLRWCGSGQRAEEEYARNRCYYALQIGHRPESGGCGPSAVLSCRVGLPAGISWAGFYLLAREAVGKVCGVPVAMPLGRAALLLGTGQQ